LGTLGQYAEALACSERAIQLRPQLAEAWFNKGAELVNGFQNYRQAQGCFEEAHQLGHPQAAQGIELCQQMLGQP
jgi:tetratricopeptide (TPR) repeat protein